MNIRIEHSRELMGSRAVAAAVEGPLTNMCPSSIRRSHSDCTLYLDDPAAAKLKEVQS